MKQLLFLCLVFSGTAFAQFSEAEKKEIYPATYTFEQANALKVKGAYEKAVWHYINLFPTAKTRVIDSVKAIGTKLDSITIGNFVKKSFVMYGTMDPEIITFTTGMPVMNYEKLNQKGAWGDELIQKVSGATGELGSAAEYNFRGLDKFKAEDFQGAIDDFDKAIALEPNGKTYFNRAFAKSVIGDYNGAINDYDKTIEAKYRLAEAYFERGYNKDMLDFGTAAIEDYTLAIKTDKNYAEAYNNRAFVYVKIKKYKQAIKDFNKAIELRPDFGGAYMNRGFAKNGAGDKKGACLNWKKALELGIEQAGKVMEEQCK